MGGPSARGTIAALLDLHGSTHAAEVGFDVGDDKPSGLSPLPCPALLFSARIKYGIAVAATRGSPGRADDRPEAGRLQPV